MTDYKVTYRMVDGSTFDIILNGRPDDIAAGDICTQLVRKPFVTHIDPNGVAMAFNIANVTCIFVEPIKSETPTE